MNEKELIKIAKNNLAEFTGFDFPIIRKISKEKDIWRVSVDITEKFRNTLKPAIVWTYDVLVDFTGNFRGYSKTGEKQRYKSIIKKPRYAKAMLGAVSRSYAYQTAKDDYFCSEL
ncbi:MAG: gas vesicle protein [Elusimicrobia bacterium]|nr:gas vesicle protein [Elusimicrobiota bacterium]